MVALKGMKLLSAVVKRDDALNTLFLVDYAIGLAGGHAFGSRINECFEFRFALDFRLPASAGFSLDCEHGRP